jgi:hypothetical protein
MLRVVEECTGLRSPSQARKSSGSRAPKSGSAACRSERGRLDGRSAAATATRKDRDEEEHQEDYEEYLGNPRSSARDAAESEDARNEGDHKKDDSVVEHGFVWFGFLFGGDFSERGLPHAHGGSRQTGSLGLGGLQLRDEAADVLLGFTRALLDAANHLFFLSFLEEKIVIRELGILLFELALQGVPIAFEREFSHDVFGLVFSGSAFV